MRDAPVAPKDRATDVRDTPRGRLPAWAPIAFGIAVLAVLLAASVVTWAFGWMDQEDMEDWGYAGVFVTNFLPHVSLFIPLPGMTAVGHGLIIWGAEELNPVLVVIIGTVAMTTAEFTSYLAGVTGRQTAESQQFSIGGRPGEWLKSFWGWLDRFMQRAGYFALFLLSAVPNPFFEFTGITAGALRMNFLALAVGLGHLVRIILLVVLGHELLDAVGL